MSPELWVGIWVYLAGGAVTFGLSVGFAGEPRNSNDVVALFLIAAFWPLAWLAGIGIALGEHGSQR